MVIMFVHVRYTMNFPIMLIILAFLLANVFTSNDFSSLSPVVEGGCSSPQDSLGKAILHKNVTGSCEGRGHTRL